MKEKVFSEWLALMVSQKPLSVALRWLGHFLMGWGTGLCFADASTRSNTQPIPQLQMPLL